jgi:hypothetical protein
LILSEFYRDSTDNGYGGQPPVRFSVLRELMVESILDIGSGPCSLLEWLTCEGYTGDYEAVDIREDALKLCPCNTYTSIPNKTYDLVCLFGTKGFNVGGNKEANRKEFELLLRQSDSLAEKYLVFSVIKKENDSSRIVGYSVDEVLKICETLESRVISISSNLEPTEHIFVCEKNKQPS